ncbi:unnamed protein product, partial [Tetraodon nigroviridis]
LAKQVSASDLDFGENAKISYSILDSKVQEVSVSSYVYINSDNGSIYSMHSFDYEKLKVFQIQVQAKDQGSPSLSSNASVHVFILDQNDNAPAVIYPSSAALGSLSHQRMPRSAKAGHLLTKVTAVDADSGHNAWVSYRLAEATDASLFTVNQYTGEVRTKRAVSEQDDSSQRLLIEIRDDGEPTQSSTVTLSVLLEDGLHEPILDLRQKIAEPSQKSGRITLYLIVSLASVSVLSLLTFLVLAKPNRNLQIQLNTDGPIKYVEVLGGDVMSQSQSFRSCMSPMSEYSDFTLIKPSSTTDFKEVISVLDASLSTSYGQTRYSIPEELKQGSVVGNLAKDLGLGLSDIYERKLRVASEAGKQYFSVDAGKGELVVNDRIDREALCGQSASCVLPLQVVIEDPLQLFRVEVEIQDINDNAPRFPSNDVRLEIAESTALGVRFPLESAIDPDAGSNSLKSYTLSKDECFNIRVKDVAGGRKVPELIIAKNLDRERKAVHKLVLTAIDGGNPVRSGSAQLTIIVLDINDNVPAFEKTQYKASVSEDAEKGTVIIQTKATDLDDGQNAEIEYSFGAHTPENVLSVFAIDPLSGTLSLHGKLDFEQTVNYEIDISSKDKGNPRMEGHCTVHIDIVDVNDNAPDIILTSHPKPVREDSPNGTVVALISARDLDSARNGEVILQLPRHYPFSLKPSFSQNYALVTSGVLDRENISEYNIEVIATDSGSPPLSSRKIIPVSITDVNDNPPVFTQASYNVYLKENGLPGSILYSVSASDLDFGENAKISYSILDSKVQEVSVSSYVYINSDNGSIYSMHSFDYEKLKVFQIQVQAKDQGSPSLSSNASVHVFILDQNDNAPAVIYPSSAALGSLSHQRMPRSAKAGHLLTKVTAVDADSGHNAWVSYRLAEATDASLFTVNQYTGEVRTKRAVSEQDDSSQRLLIEIRDDGEPTQSSTVTLSVLLEDGLHEPILDLRQKIAEPSQKSGRITLYLIVSLASVSVLSLLTFLVLAYVEVLGGDVMSQSQSFRSCMSPMSEYSDFTLIKPSSTTDFKEVISVLDASLPDSTWTFESQQVSSNGQTRYSIPEELKQGSVVGNLAKDLGLGLSDIYERKLRVASEAGKQYFSVDAGKGELVVNDRIDREALCGQSASCVLPLQVVIEDPLQLHRIEVEIRDINDNSPSFLSNELTLKIAELAVVGTRFPLESAHDPDVGSNSLKLYTLSKNDCFSLKIKEIEGGKTVPELVLEKPLDREKKALHKILLTALDGGNPVRSGTSQITINVLDINDNFPVFEKNLYKVTLGEKSFQGALVIKPKATDADEGSNGEIEFSFGSRTPDSVLSVFEMNRLTGEITLKGPLDYETTASYDIDVTAKDKGSPEMEGHCRVQVDVLDFNDNPPEIVFTSQPKPVREDAPNGTVVALISARDLDSGENGKVLLQLPKGSPFTLKPSFSNNYALVTSGVLDREKISEYNIEVTATDSGSPPLSSRKIIPVSITDVNDNPPVFTQASYNVYLKENGLPGSILYSVSASDLDFGENAKISYSILDSKVQEVSVSSYVYINSDNGSIYSMHSFDYEKLKVFQIQVQAKDQGSPSLSSNASVHVFILDQNDNAPAVIYPSSAALRSLSHQRMPRSAKAGHLLTKVTAVDADSGHNAWVSYRLAEATDASLFTVNQYTGEVRTKRAVSEQDDSSQRLLIEIRDDGEPTQSSTVTLSVLLEDGLHEPILDLRQKIAEPSQKSGRITLYLIVSLASVSVLSLLTFLVLAVRCIRSSRGSGSCCMRRSDCDDYKKPNRNLQIQLNTDGPIKYVEVLGGDVMSQSQSFRSCMSPMSEYSDFTLIKPSSTTDFKEVISVLDASLPDSTWTFESQQTRYSIPEELEMGSTVGNLAKDLGLGISDIYERKLRVASEAGKQYFSVDAGKGELVVNDRIDREALCGQSASCVLPLQVVVEKPLQLHRIEVEIRDVNDNSPSFLKSDHVLEVAESTVVGMTKRMGCGEWRWQALWWHHFFLLWSTIDGQIRYSVPEELKQGSVVGNLAKDLGLGLSDIYERKLRVASEAGMTKRMGCGEWRWQALWWHHFFLLWSTIDGQIRYSVPEELKQGSVVGNLAKDLGLGLSDIYERKLRVASEAGKQYFSVDAGKGELVVNDRIDREALCGQSASCVLTLQVVTEKPLQLHRIEVEIKDINDNSPNFLTAERFLKIAESTAAGVRFPLETAQDQDVGSNSVKSYTLSKNECFSLKIKDFSGEQQIPELVLDKALDREKEASHHLLLTALDGGNPVKTGTTTIIVTVLDNNDNVPVFQKPLYNISVPENSSASSMLLKVEATDADEGVNGEIEYSFAEHTPQNILSIFRLDSNTGEIFLVGQLDYEKNTMHEIGITAKDKGQPEMEGHCRVKIMILDINDNAPEIILTSTPNPVREDAQRGTVVALISARDYDSGNNGKVMLRLPKHLPFTLKPSFSNNFALVTSGVLDREKVSEYNIEVTATDSGSPPLSSRKIIPVSITDVNDNPPVFTQASYNVYLKENGLPGSILYSVSASDLDFGENAKISYSILDSKVQGVSVSSYVYINSDNGSIYSMHSFDYEKLKVFQIQVQAKDQGSPSLSSNASVHVFILDQNDNAPAVIYPSSAALGSLSHQRMPRSAKAGHLLTKVTAVDADSGHNAWVSYRLAEATDASLFTVNQYTGEVRTKRTVSEQDDSSQRLLIEIRDDGEPTQSSTVTLSVLLEDGLHEPILDLRQKIAEPSQKSGRITLYLIVSLASVSVLSLLTFLVLAKPNRNLQIQLNTDGPIKYVEVLGGDVMSQSQSFRSCMSPMSEYSDFTLIKPSSTTDFKEVISVLDASLPDSTWTFESQQVSSNGQTRYSIPEELKQGSVVGNLAKDLGLGLSDIYERKLRVASEAGKQYFSVDAGKGELVVNDRIDREALCGQSASCVLPLQASYNVYFEENGLPGSILYSVSASDLDFGENAKISYSILDSKVQEVSVSSYVYINSDNGSIYSMHSFDYEKLKVFQIQVQAKDQGSPSLSSNASVHVFILDQNDNAPAVIYPSSAALGSLSHQRMPRSAKAGHLLTKVTAVDADSGHNAWVSYRLAEATDASLFTVNQYTGEVRTKRAVSEQDDSSQRLLIEIRDDGEPTQSSTVTLSVLLEDGLHEPILDLRQKIAEPSQKSGRITLYLIVSLASVSVLSLLTFLVLAVRCIRSSRGSGSCCMRRSDCDDYKKPNRNLQIQLNTDGPIKYVEVLGGDVMSQSQSFRSCMSPMSEYSDFTLIKPSSTTDFKEVISVLDASLPDSTWTFESQQLSYSVSEELSPGSVVGNIAQGLGLSAGEIVQRRLRVVSDHTTQYFEVKETTGDLVIKQKIDREQLCELSSTCSLHVQVLLENPLDFQRVEVDILDVNDNAPRFSTTNISLEISEAAAQGTRFRLESAHDPDVGSNSLRTYHLETNDFFKLKVETKSDGTKFPELVVEKALDRETQASFRLLLTALDGGQPEKSGSTLLLIKILDVNDNAPVFNEPVTRVRLLENVALGTLVTKLNATDADSGSNGDISFLFSKYTSERVLNVFSVDSKSGEIRVKGDVDYEKNSVYHFTVQARDGGSPAMEGSCNVIVDVIDVNDNAPEVTLTSLNSPIREDSAPETVIALISVRDLDSGVNGKVMLTIQPGLPFRLNSAFSMHYSLITAGQLDRESVPEYTVVVKAADGGSPPLSSQTTFVVKLSDVNDNAPTFSQPSYSIDIQENNALNAPIAVVSATDPDLGDNSRIAYSILPSTVLGSPISSYVYINPESGHIYSMRSLDHEQLNAFRIEVQARDAGTPARTANVTVHVFVVDVNDNAPVLVHPSLLKDKRLELTVPPSATPGYFISKLVGVDADSGHNAWLFYSVASGPNAGMFRIGAHSGELRTAHKSSRYHQRPSKDLHLQLNTDGPIRYMEVVGGAQDPHTRTYRPCYSTISSRSDFVFMKTPMLSHNNTLNTTLSRKYLMNSASESPHAIRYTHKMDAEEWDKICYAMYVC